MVQVLQRERKAVEELAGVEFKCYKGKEKLWRSWQGWSRNVCLVSVIRGKAGTLALRRLKSNDKCQASLGSTMRTPHTPGFCDSFSVYLWLSSNSHSVDQTVFKLPLPPKRWD